MGIKSSLSYPFAKYIIKKNNRWKTNAVNTQNKLLLSLIIQAKNTRFGKDHHFDKITNYADWKRNVPVRDYEALKNYIGEIIEGKENDEGK